MRVEPRWLDREAAAEYISVRPSALDRLVKDGLVPGPAYPLGRRRPRWDRLALDNLFQGGAASTHPDQVMSAVAQDILRGR